MFEAQEGGEGFSYATTYMPCFIIRSGGWGLETMSDIQVGFAFSSDMDVCSGR